MGRLALLGELRADFAELTRELENIPLAIRALRERQAFLNDVLPSMRRTIAYYDDVATDEEALPHDDSPLPEPVIEDPIPEVAPPTAPAAATLEPDAPREVLGQTEAVRKVLQEADGSLTSAEIAALAGPMTAKPLKVKQNIYGLLDSLRFQKQAATVDGDDGMQRWVWIGPKQTDATGDDEITRLDANGRIVYAPNDNHIHEFRLETGATVATCKLCGAPKAFPPADTSMAILRRVAPQQQPEVR